MSRVQWNWCCECDGEPHLGMAHKYAYLPNMTVTATPMGIAAPTPGAIEPEQRRRLQTFEIKRCEQKRTVKAEAREEKQAHRAVHLKFTKSDAAALAGAAAAGAAAATAGAAAAVVKIVRKLKK